MEGNFERPKMAVVLAHKVRQNVVFEVLQLAHNIREPPKHVLTALTQFGDMGMGENGVHWGGFKIVPNIGDTDCFREL